MNHDVTPVTEAYVMGHSNVELHRLAQQSKLPRELTEDVLRKAGLRSGMRVLDLGGGDATLLAAALVGPNGHLTGIERSADAVGLARARAANRNLHWVDFVRSDVETFVAREPYDAIIGRIVLLDMADPTATLRSLTRSLRPGGIVAFQELVIGASHTEPGAPVFKRRTPRVTGVLETAGVTEDDAHKSTADGMTAEQLQVFGDALYQEIPLLESLGLAVRHFDGLNLSAHAPLAPNINDKRTAFAGSLSTIATIAPWCLLTLITRGEGMECEIVVYKSDIRFLAPLRGDFSARTSLSRAMRDQLMATLRSNSRAKIELEVAISENNGVRVEARFKFSLKLKP